MRKWIDVLREFEKPATGGGDLPPVMDMERGGGGDRHGGRYWVSPQGKIAVAKGKYGADEIGFAQMVFAHPEKFGLTLDQIYNEINRADLHDSTRDMVHRSVARWHAEGPAYPNAGPAQFSAGSTLGMNILLRRGWVFVDYDPPSEISITGSKASIQHDIEAVMDSFPLMQCERIEIHMKDASVEGFGKHVGGTTFHREDYPGFAGHINALLEWLGGDKEPRAHYIYVEKDRAKLDHGYLNIGRTAGKQGFFMPYVPEAPYGRHLRNKADYIRFPADEIISQGVRLDYSQLHGTIMHSDKEFHLPPNVQTWNGRHWS